MKKTVCALLAALLCLSFVSCGDNGLTESLTNISDSKLTPTLPENYMINFLDDESTNIIVAKVGDEFFHWCDEDTVMHYYHKTDSGWDEYTRNAQEADDYDTAPTAHYDTLDSVIAKALSPMTETGGIELKDTSPKQEVYDGLNCLKYESGKDYLYVSTDYNIVVEACKYKDSENMKLYGFYDKEDSLLVGDDYSEFHDESMIPEQFR